MRNLFQHFLQQVQNIFERLLKDSNKQARNAKLISVFFTKTKKENTTFKATHNHSLNCVHTRL